MELTRQGAERRETSASTLGRSARGVHREKQGESTVITSWPAIDTAT